MMKDSELKTLIKGGTVETIREACNHLAEEDADEARWAKVFSKSIITGLVKKGEICDMEPAEWVASLRDSEQDEEDWDDEE